MSEQTEPQSLGEKAQFEVVWLLMRELGIGTIIVEFSGEGDSGDINDVDARPIDAEPAWDPKDPDRQAKQDEWRKRSIALAHAMQATLTGIVRDDVYNIIYPPGVEHKPGELPLDKLVEVLTRPMLDTLGHDWVNNEGGFGTVRWIGGGDDNDDPPMIEIEVSIRVVTTDDYSYEYDKYGELPNQD